MNMLCSLCQFNLNWMFVDKAVEHNIFKFLINFYRQQN